MKIAINAGYGGFSLSEEAVRMLHSMGCKYVEAMDPSVYYGDGWESKFEKDKKIAGSGWGPIIEGDKILMDNTRYTYSSYSQEFDYSPRADQMLIEVIERLGEEANGRCAKLKIIEVPDDTVWTISEYDGWESVHEKHRSWE